MKTWLPCLFVALCLLPSCGKSERDQFHEDFFGVLESMPEEVGEGSPEQALQGIEDMRVALEEISTAGLNPQELVHFQTIVGGVEQLEAVVKEAIAGEQDLNLPRAQWANEELGKRFGDAIGDLMTGIMMLSMSMGEM